MKKLYLILSMLVAVVSCSEDDQVDKGIIGIWIPTREEYDNCMNEVHAIKDYDIGGCDVTSCKSITITEETFTTTRKADGFVYTTTYVYIKDGTVMKLEISTTDEWLEYKLDGDILTIRGYDEEAACQLTTTYKRRM